MLSLMYKIKINFLTNCAHVPCAPPGLVRCGGWQCQVCGNIAAVANIDIAIVAGSSSSACIIVKI